MSKDEDKPKTKQQLANIKEGERRRLENQQRKLLREEAEERRSLDPNYKPLLPDQDIWG